MDVFLNTIILSLFHWSPALLDNEVLQRLSNFKDFIHFTILNVSTKTKLETKGISFSVRTRGIFLAEVAILAPNMKLLSFKAIHFLAKRKMPSYTELLKQIYVFRKAIYLYPPPVFLTLYKESHSQCHFSKGFYENYLINFAHPEFSRCLQL